MTVHLKFSFLATSAALALSGCSKSAPDPRTGPALVEVTTAGTGGDSVRSFSGVVSARVQSDLGFRIPGKVIARMVDTGATVRRGQPLMRIDATDYGLANAAQNNAVAAAKARASQTGADEARYRDLVSAGAVSASRYDQAKADSDAARAQLAAAVAQARVAKNATGYSVLLADADGVVVETLAEPGQVVTAGQTVVRLARSGPREASISLPETVRPGVGSSAKAALYGGSGATGSARLRQLSDSADPQARTFEARYVLEGAAANAPLGSTVSISLSDGRGPGGIQVPLSAVTDNGHGPGVWTLSGSGNQLKTAWRPITVSGIGEETATVTSGLQPGERFVALGAHVLHQGQPVILSTTRLATGR